MEANMTKSGIIFEGISAGQPNSVFPVSSIHLPALVSIREFCRCMSIGRTTAYSLINSGDVEICRIGRRTLVKVESVAKLVADGTIPSSKSAGDR
ncbi:helix-turn-helix domain-containing protein [Sphingopyxis italica]|uniref:helix-turn-helix domain-containing protein n=1 Tax=Sphingopyxis italica TaxID=1129133 RepID=UPI003613BCA1